MNANDKEDATTLEILEAIDAQRDVTQRHLSETLGIALGLTNSYLKRCAKKGLVKVQQAPANRYFYYLTPRGFSEKGRLTAQYFSSSLVFYRKAGENCNVIFEQAREQNLNRILLCGASELAEIASLRAKDSKIRIVGTYDTNYDGKRFLGKPLWSDFSAVAEFDACVITDVLKAKVMLAAISKHVDKANIFIPEVLGLGI